MKCSFLTRDQVKEFIDQSILYAAPFWLNEAIFRGEIGILLGKLVKVELVHDEWQVTYIGEKDLICFDEEDEKVKIIKGD